MIDYTAALQICFRGLLSSDIIIVATKKWADKYVFMILYCIIHVPFIATHLWHLLIVTFGVNLKGKYSYRGVKTENSRLSFRRSNFTLIESKAS